MKKMGFHQYEIRQQDKFRYHGWSTYLLQEEIVGEVFANLNIQYNLSWDPLLGAPPGTTGTPLHRRSSGGAWSHVKTSNAS